jgi:hypothetical protein
MRASKRLGKRRRSNNDHIMCLINKEINIVSEGIYQVVVNEIKSSRSNG